MLVKGVPDVLLPSNSFDIRSLLALFCVIRINQALLKKRNWQLNAYRVTSVAQKYMWLYFGRRIPNALNVRWHNYESTGAYISVYM